jgi:hypothetical protein
MWHTLMVSCLKSNGRWNPAFPAQSISRTCSTVSSRRPCRTPSNRPWRSARHQSLDAVAVRCVTPGVRDYRIEARMAGGASVKILGRDASGTRSIGNPPPPRLDGGVRRGAKGEKIGVMFA